jgi:hypothetical protein
MVKTHRKKSGMSKTKKHNNHMCKYPATMHGLNKWFEKMFEELGWMILAKNHGYTDKVNTYKNSLKRLHEHLECKVHSVHEVDRKNDLEIMLQNVDILIRHANKDL